MTSTGRFYGKQAKLPYNEYLTGGDVALVWWDTDTVGPSVAVNLPDSRRRLPVHGRREALHPGPDPVQGDVLRQVELDQRDHHRSAGRRAARLPVRRLPEQRRNHIVTMLFVGG